MTFLGPWDEWMKKAGIYKHLYEMDTKIAYDWLWVWVDAKHPSFQNCTIVTSDSVRDGLKLIMEKIIEEAIMTTDPDIIGLRLLSSRNTTIIHQFLLPQKDLDIFEKGS